MTYRPLKRHKGLWFEKRIRTRREAREKKNEEERVFFEEWARYDRVADILAHLLEDQDKRCGVFGPRRPSDRDYEIAATVIQWLGTTVGMNWLQETLNKALAARARRRAKSTKRVRYRCAVCGKVTGGRAPKGGDGSFFFPRRHDHPDGASPCPGTFEEAKWVERTES